MIIKIKHLIFFSGIIALTIGAVGTYAQKAKVAAPRTPPVMPQLPPQLMPPHPANKMQQRYFDIDAKRMIEDVNGDDALPRSREFKRIDSTYYVGWMFEGAYKYNHSADYLGYRNAAVPLERALDLIEHDYAKALATRTGDIMTFYPIRILVPDYTMIAYYLMNCYANTDQPDKVYKLLRRTLKWKFQASYYMDSWNHLAWTVHRNRFYTTSKYSFLKNSIEENEKLAQRYLDTSMMTIEKNSALNEQLGANVPFLHGNADRERIGVYHYRNILYSYSFQIDSAAYYFELMRKAGRLPHNNFANFKGICGDFRTAESEYKLASMQDAGDKRLQEWAYYSSIIDIYKAKTAAGASLSKNMIKAAGSTPGYGWYNIALARCMTYDGQISESDRYADKAADFKELHIGTTLGQSQYDFSVQLLKLINKEQTWEMQKFEHANWWYNPAVLVDMTGKLSETYLQQLLIINQFALNPERDRVIYKLFSTESTVSWDEVWYLLHDFSTEYFIKRFQKEAETDSRAYIRKYYELFVARLKMQQGKYKEAKPMLDKLLTDPNTDVDYEKLFIARVYQAEAECAKELKDASMHALWLYRLYTLYPQLVPFTGMAMNMNLHISGEVDKDVEKHLRACNIHWVTDRSIPAPEAYVEFSHTGKNRDITYYVLDQTGNYIVQKQSFAWQKADEAGKQLAYKLFNIGSKVDEKESE